MSETGSFKKILPKQESAELRSIFSQVPLASLSGRKITVVGTYAPRKCGIATFTQDIAQKLAAYHPEFSIDIYALDKAESNHIYQGVAGVIDVNNPESYSRAAQEINEAGSDAVWIQHEYGIYGGADGEMVCDFIDRLAAPLILTPHTVLSEPSANQEHILKHLVNRASRIMVMSQHSRDLLASRYGAPHCNLEVIAHGAPDRPFGRQEQFKDTLGLAGRPVLMTFGLLGPGKGIESMIEAMPAILSRHSHAVYRIVGATHPDLVLHDGEAYRDSLKELAKSLGVSDSIQWDDRFLETEELLDQLEACDVYVTPYPGMQQSTSGTLSYAVAFGKAVVSTPYVHARELLADGVGIFVEPGSSEALAGAIVSILDDPEQMTALQRRAYAKGRLTIWPKFAEAAASLIENTLADENASATALATPSLFGVVAMTDSVGMLQHSIGIIPDRRHGYCLDDNARALMLLNIADGVSELQRCDRTMTYASFVQYAWNEEVGRFRNFMHFDRSWLEASGSEDSNGRAFRALGHTIEMAKSTDVRNWAVQWYDKALPSMVDLTSPRAVAFVMLGAAARLRLEPGHAASLPLLERGADLLCRILDDSRRPDWEWFEVMLAYDNPRLSHALIESGIVCGREDWVRTGLLTLEWIIGLQCAANGNFRPIGSESSGNEHTAMPFDQQPLEVQAAIEACAAAFCARPDKIWLDHAERAWRWFFGSNDRGVVLAEIESGRCRDGLTPRGANENCGAESILAFQLSHYSMLSLIRAYNGGSAGKPYEPNRDAYPVGDGLSGLSVTDT